MLWMDSEFFTEALGSTPFVSVPMVLNIVKKSLNNFDVF